MFGHKHKYDGYAAETGTGNSCKWERKWHFDLATFRNNCEEFFDPSTSYPRSTKPARLPAYPIAKLVVLCRPISRVRVSFSLAILALFGIKKLKSLKKELWQELARSIISEKMVVVYINEKQSWSNRQWNEYLLFYPMFRTALPYFIGVLQSVAYTLMKKGSSFQNIGWNNTYFFGCLISHAFSRLHLKNYCWSDLSPGSGASFCLRLVHTYIFVVYTTQGYFNPRFIVTK